MTGLEGAELRELVDVRRTQHPGSVLFLYSEVEPGKAALTVSVPKELTGRFHAGNLTKAILPSSMAAAAASPNIAQGGGKSTADPKALWEALLAAAQG